MLAAGPRALARRDAALRQFTGLLDAGRAETVVEPPAITSLSSPAASANCSTARSSQGKTARLPSRLPDLMFWIVLPFLGNDAAAAEHARVSGPSASA